MEKKSLQCHALIEEFFKAVKEKTLLVVIDSASKGDKAVFRIVSFARKNEPCYGYTNYSNMLNELGFKHYRNNKQNDLYVTHCAGRFSLFILDNIGCELKGRGVELPNKYYEQIQYQNSI